jgi:integrase
MKLTTSDIDLPEGKSELLIFDDELKGFCLRLRRGKGGHVIKNWMVAYRVPGHQRRMIVGDAYKITATQARAEAKKALAQVELGGDPQREKKDTRDENKTLYRTVVEEFLKAKADEVKPETVRLLKQYLLGPLGIRADRADMRSYLKGLHPMPLARITKADVGENLRKVESQSIRRGVRKALNAMFVWAMQEGLAEDNPVVGTRQQKAKDPRDRVLSNMELVLIWKAVPDDDFGRVIRLLILTGCRRQEVGAMRWSEFNEDETEWTVPKERSKNGQPNTLPITSLMKEVLPYRRDGKDNLFGLGRRFTKWSGKQSLNKKLDLKPWTIHDLRRSFATGLGNLGVQPHVIEAILNHKSGAKRGVAGVYNRSPYQREVAQAMALWSDHIRALVDGTERKVLPFRA